MKIVCDCGHALESTRENGIAVLRVLPGSVGARMDKSMPAVRLVCSKCRAETTLWFDGQLDGLPVETDTVLTAENVARDRRTARHIYRVGDLVKFKMGAHETFAEVIEDRGGLGHGGEQIVRVRSIDVGNLADFELSAHLLEPCSITKEQLKMPL